MRQGLLCAAFLAGLLSATPGIGLCGVILSEEVTVSVRGPMNAPADENLLDAMDLRALSPSARLLAMPHMISPRLAEAMRSGQVRTSPEEWKAIIRKAVAASGLPASLIEAVIRIESDFKASAVSSKGAQGAMQIMPETQKELGLEQPYDAEANVLAGCTYLRRQLDSFGSLELALAAYNAGPGNVRRYGGIPPFAETQDYVRRVLELHRAADKEASSSRAAARKR